LLTTKVPLLDVWGNVVALLGMYEELPSRDSESAEVRIRKAMCDALESVRSAVLKRSPVVDCTEPSGNTCLETEPDQVSGIVVVDQRPQWPLEVKGLVDRASTLGVHIEPRQFRVFDEYVDELRATILKHQQKKSDL
jgi:hypothetical protein